MPKKKRPVRATTAAQRKRIMADAKKNGMTADQVAKKYGISKWTYYGWTKRAGGTTTRKKSGTRTKTTTIDPKTIRAEIRAVLPGILREELARALGVMTKRSR
ncbi:MAG: transposase [Candidatus Eisenbacteria bacterium]